MLLLVASWPFFLCSGIPLPKLCAQNPPDKEALPDMPRPPDLVFQSLSPLTCMSNYQVGHKMQEHTVNAVCILSPRIVVPEIISFRMACQRPNDPMPYPWRVESRVRAWKALPLISLSSSHCPELQALCVHMAAETMWTTSSTNADQGT